MDVFKKGNKVINIFTIEIREDLTDYHNRLFSIFPYVYFFEFNSKYYIQFYEDYEVSYFFDKKKTDECIEIANKKRKKIRMNNFEIIDDVLIISKIKLKIKNSVDYDYFITDKVSFELYEQRIRVWELHNSNIFTIYYIFSKNDTNIDKKFNKLKDSKLSNLYSYILNK